ncbi:methyltransferase family protein [Hyphobacterium sp.]|jgi:protein-S-isoprenylcysteine O-methyltransferase Ste14|uniref:methyltransferase family protein n=1 Tax=Hyphobacterium sp. TaxID=2004662 RepID=UPI003BAA009F
MRPLIPPPVILIFFIGIALGLDILSPLDFLTRQARLPLVILFAGLGIMVAALGIMAFRRHRTTINPHRINEASALVTTGIYRLTRNPMYLGMLLVLFAVVAYTGDLMTLLAPIGFIVTLNRLQIRPEERALVATFGNAYSAYCDRVRRWI